MAGMGTLGLEEEVGEPELRKPQRKQRQLCKVWAKSCRGSGWVSGWMGKAERNPKVVTNMFDSGGSSSQNECRSLGRSESSKYTQTKANESCSLFRR